jgi:hypothetical protein
MWITHFRLSIQQKSLYVGTFQSMGFLFPALI